MTARPPSEFVGRTCCMFGGHGIRCDGLTFALTADGTLCFKVDDGNRAASRKRSRKMAGAA